MGGTMPGRYGRLLVLALLLVIWSISAAALDINSSHDLRYFPGDDPQFQVDETGEITAYGDLDMQDSHDIVNLNQLDGFFGDCSGDQVVQSIGDDGDFTCTDPGADPQNLSDVLTQGNVANTSIEFDNGIEIGDSDTATTHEDAIAIGKDADATNGYAAAMGWQTSASDYAAVALGMGASASGSQSSVALGRGTNASGEGSVAIGGHSGLSGSSEYPDATASYSMALGSGSTADAEAAVAIGPDSIAPNPYEATFGNLDGDELDVNVTGDTTVHGDTTLHGPLSVESPGAMQVANGLELTDSTSNTIESYDTLYLETSSGSPSDIVLDPSGEVGISGNLDMAGNNITGCEYINGVDCDELGGAGTLEEVLAGGNTAGTHNIDMEDSDIQSVDTLEVDYLTGGDTMGSNGPHIDTGHEFHFNDDAPLVFATDHDYEMRYDSTDNEFKLSSYGGGTDYMTVDQSGNVGLPAGELETQGGQGAQLVTNVSDGDYAYWQFTDTSFDDAQIGYDPRGSNGDNLFYVWNDEGVTGTAGYMLEVKDSGDVHVPSGGLDVGGTIETRDDSEVIMETNATGQGWAGWYFYDNDFDDAQIGYDPRGTSGDNLFYVGNDEESFFYTLEVKDTGDVHIPSGDLNMDGNDITSDDDMDITADGDICIGDCGG